MSKVSITVVVLAAMAVPCCNAFEEGEADEDHDGAHEDAEGGDVTDVDELTARDDVDLVRRHGRITGITRCS